MNTIIPGPLMRNMENLPEAELYADGLEDSELPRDCMCLLWQTAGPRRAASTRGERTRMAAPGRGGEGQYGAGP
ncbi:hypothetical protein NicSoilB4_09070 [Arthrobacter sp. NicSoilB4]|nr:hypothetical protein NicSoilB4_09070 [Arthrobacter sp. NicSoilB4]